jgi:hypothetical protein
MATILLEPNTQHATRNTSAEVVVSVRGLTKVFKDFWGRSKARAVVNQGMLASPQARANLGA